MNVAEKMKKHIQDKGLTYGSVAVKANIQSKKFYRIINGNQKMSVEEFEKICKEGLGVKPSFFLK